VSKTIAILTSGGDSPGMNAAIRAATVRALLAGEHRKMVSWLPPMDLPDGVGARSKDDPYCYLVDLPAVLAATKQLLEG